MRQGYSYMRVLKGGYKSHFLSPNFAQIPFPSLLFFQMLKIPVPVLLFFCLWFPFPVTKPQPQWPNSHFPSENLPKSQFPVYPFRTLLPSWLYKLTTGNFVTNKTLFTTFQKSQWLKFARCLCNAESRCLSTRDFRRWSITISHNKQNNSPSSMWNVPVTYFLVRSWAVRLGRKVGTCLLGRRNSGRFH